MGVSSILRIISGPVSEIINKAVKDKDLAVKLQHDIVQELIASESSYISEVSSIIKAEANGDSWLQRSWRPLTMLFFASLLGMYWFGYAPDYLVNSPKTVEDLFDLLKLGIGGYIFGRSGEKMVRTIAENGGIRKALG